MANCWYRRTLELHRVANDDKRTPLDRARAMKMYTVMVGRILHINQIALRIVTPKAPDFLDGATPGKINRKV